MRHDEESGYDLILTGRKIFKVAVVLMEVNKTVCRNVPPFHVQSSRSHSILNDRIANNTHGYEYQASVLLI